jgi:D-3-phosphoglycerate dehydrogenase
LKVSDYRFSYHTTIKPAGARQYPPYSSYPQECTRVLSAINTQLSNNNINILAQNLKTNDEIGYVVLDVDKKLSKQAVGLLKEVKDTIKVRLLY